MSLTIVLADDHAVVRSGLRTLLTTELGATILGEAWDGRDAVEVVARLCPEVLVLDLLMPGLGGLEVVRRVRLLERQPQIVVLSMYADEAYVREAFRAGVIGYVLKEAPAGDVIEAVRAAATGRRFLSSALRERLLDAYLQQPATAATDPYDLLSERERDVLHLAALGHTAAEIAEHLALSVRTVETYRTHILRKLDLRHQTDLVRYAIQRGIIPLDR